MVNWVDYSDIVTIVVNRVGLSPLQPVVPERIWKWGRDKASTRSTRHNLVVPLYFFGFKNTISRFGERFRGGQYSLVSFLFAVLLLTVLPRAQPFVKVGARRSPFPYEAVATETNSINCFSECYVKLFSHSSCQRIGLSRTAIAGKDAKTRTISRGWIESKNGAALLKLAVDPVFFQPFLYMEPFAAWDCSRNSMHWQS